MSSGIAANMITPTKANRNGNRPRTPSDSASSQASDDFMQEQHQSNGRKSHPGKRPNKSLANAVHQNDTSPEDGDDEDEDEDGESDGDEFAPSGDPANKRGHQTGLSISLSNACLGKRGRSPSSDIEDRPMSKRSKTDGEGETSDDDVYNKVDDISASEDEGDGEVENLEEQAIIQSEEEDVISLHKKHGSFSSLDSFMGTGVDADLNSIFSPPATFFDDGLADVLRRDSLVTNENETETPIRRVRFAEEVLAREARSSSTTESEDEAPIYPDLFVQQNSLDPEFRKLVEGNNEGSISDGEGSYWDFENDNRVEELDDNDDDSESGSSGYETDEGETTDEDFNVPQTVKPELGLLRFDAQGRARPKATPTPTTTPIKRALAVARKGPTMGSFVVDEDKPIALIDGHGKNMLIFPAPKQRRTMEGSPPPSVASGPSRALISAQPQSETESDVGFTHVDPMLSSPANAMVSGLYNGRPGRSASNLSNLSNLTNEILGPEEAFFPFVNMNKDGMFEPENNDPFEDDMFSEADLNIEDFINFDDGSSDEENNGLSQKQADQPSSNNTTNEDEDADKTPRPTSKFTAVKPRLPSTPTPSGSGSLLDHFDRGIASSFRRNADRHKNWTRSPISGGIKGGRFDFANNPISPMRRRKGAPATPSSQLHRMQPPEVPASAARIGQHQFGGPLKKRIRNSEAMQRIIQRQNLRKRKDSF